MTIIMLKVENKIGRCKPVTDAYNRMHSAVCSALLDGTVSGLYVHRLLMHLERLVIIQNGLWCSVLWCVCDCICLIITGTAITVFMRRSNIQG